MSFPQAHHYASTLFRLEESAINTRMKGTTSRFPARLPKQIQRALPIYVALVLIVLFFWKAESIESSIKPADVLKRVLAYQTPLAITHSAFPRKIWQTWKIDPLEFEERDSIRARSWTSLNPSHRYEVLTDGNDLHYVETHFGPTGLNRPDIVYMYRSLTATIIKADLLRYLIMYIEGGVYADIDVEALVPVDRFIPFHFDERDIDLVISVEIDEPKFANHTILGPKSQSFCQWTFMSKPRNPAMLRIINNVIAWLNDVSKRQNVPVAEIHLNFDEVLTGTGPSAFTTAIMAEMTAQTGHAVKWETFHNISEPRLVGSILVLTVEAFAAGQGHSNSGDHNSKKALVKHHYHASLWPSRHQRYSHPAYGMVEECNWNTECVNSWDSNTGVFPSLPEEEQQRLIAAKEQVDRERFDRETAEKEAEEKETADKKAADHLISCMAVVEAAEKALAEGLSEGSATVTATQTVEATEATPAPEAQEGDATPAPEAQEGDATPASDAQAAGDSPAPEAQATPEAQAPEEAQKPTEQKAEEQAPAAAAETVNMFTPFSVHTDAKRSTNEKRDWRWKDEEQQ